MGAATCDIGHDDISRGKCPDVPVGHRSRIIGEPAVKGECATAGLTCGGFDSIPSSNENLDRGSVHIAEPDIGHAPGKQHRDVT
ncbi:MAG: hypothetical protein DWP92_11655 [Armatimonadetes bacterium]|nr:MAG: hypothetical protein DWP92_11655 [Armatimonadota bacterium]